MSKNKTNCEETSPDEPPRSRSLKELSATQYDGQCNARKRQTYDELRGRKAGDAAEALSNRIWFDDLPPHTD